MVMLSAILISKNVGYSTDTELIGRLRPMAVK